MSARDELIVKYVADLKDKCGVNPDMDLLAKVTIGCGPSIYNDDSATVAGSQQVELDTEKQFSNQEIRTCRWIGFRCSTRCSHGKIWSFQ